MDSTDKGARGYHHGDLRAALLKAATEELAERGVEGFTLRSCARRAGVSHAAPAHHFGDVTGLLTAVATEAFHGLAVHIRAEVGDRPAGTADHLAAVGVGYVLFAIANPAEFRLMFLSSRLHSRDPDLRRAADASFALAAHAVAAFHGSPDPMTDPVTLRRIIAFWSLCQGVASLLLTGQLGPLEAGERIVRAMLPDIVREHFGTAPRNARPDLDLIARTAAEQRR